MGRSLERPLLAGGLDVGLDPVEPEHALLVRVVVMANQVPVAVAERQPPRVDLALPPPVGEPDPPAGGDGGEQRGQVGRPGKGRHRGHETVLFHLAPELPQGLDAAGSFEAHGGGGQVQSGQLVGGQPRVLQVVGLLGDAVAHDAGLGRVVDRLHDHGDAEVAQGLLVALEGPPEGAVVLGVAGQAVAQLLGGEGPLGVQQGGDQVDQPLEPVHVTMVRAAPGVADGNVR
jgi:hypothetical protein